MEQARSLFLPSRGTWTGGDEAVRLSVTDEVKGQSACIPTHVGECDEVLATPRRGVLPSSHYVLRRDKSRFSYTLSYTSSHT